MGRRADKAIGLLLLLYGLFGLFLVLNRETFNFKVLIVYSIISIIGWIMIVSPTRSKNYTKAIRDIGDAIGDAWRGIKKDNDNDSDNAGQS